MTQLLLALLGPPEVQHGERPVSFPTRKTLALLVYLVVEGGTQPRGKLASLFWPESTHKAGRASLRNTLALLRKALAHLDEGEPAHLRVERRALGFNREAAHTLDLDLVQQALEGGEDEGAAEIAVLQAAAELARGEFLEGFSLPDAPQFDDWLTLQQEQWHLHLGRLFDTLSARQVAAGKAAAAVETLNRWLDLNPLEERAYRRLMEAYLTLGNRPAALQVYEKCEVQLAQALDVAPAPDTVALAERIREGDLQVPEATRPGSPPSVAIGSPLPSAPPSPLAGRAEEHAHLVTAYRQAERRQTALALVEGEAGIGKTTLVHHFLDWAQARGATILQGRAFASGGRLPYQPLTGALRDADLASLTLSPTWLAELSRLLPELHEHFPRLPAPGGDDATAQPRLFEAVARLVLALAGKAPLILFIDDLQWADAASLDLLQYALPRWLAAEAPILLLFAVRSAGLRRGVALQRSADSIPGDPGATGVSLRAWLATLGRVLSPVRIRLEPLSVAETEELLAALGLPAAQVPPLANWLFAETEGQPFYLAETIQALLDREVLFWQRDGAGTRRLRATAAVAAGGFRLEPGFVPPGVRDVLLGRLARLSPAAFRLLVATAVLGQGSSYRHLCRVAGVAPTAGLEALDRLLVAHLLTEANDGGRYLFTHDKIRDVVYTEAGDARRRLFHERAYRMLADRGAAPPRLLHHARAAGLLEPAFRHALAAGDEARELFAIRDAVEQYEVARRLLRDHPQLVESTDRGKILHLYRHLGRGYELLDDWPAAEETAAEMRAVASEIASPPMAVTALNRLAAIAIQSRLDVEEATALLQVAVALAEAHQDRPGLAESEWNLAQSCLHRRDREGAIAHGERALALAQTLELPALTARSHNILSYAKSGPTSLSRLAEARAHAAAGRDLFAAAGNRAMEVDCRNMLGAIALHSGRPGDAEEHLRLAWAGSVEIDNVWGQANTGFNLAQLLLETGRYGQALLRMDDSVAAARVGKPTPLVAGTLSVRGGIFRALLVPERALADHLEAQRVFVTTPNPHTAHLLVADLAADHALAGNWEEACRHAREALQHDRADAWLFSAFHEWWLVAALLHGGAELRARQAVRQFGDLIQDNPRYQIPHRRALALLAQADGDLDRATVHLAAALAHADAIGLPGERWQLLTALAALAQKQGDAESALNQRRQAQEIVDRLVTTLAEGNLREQFAERAGAWITTGPKIWE